MPLPFSRRATQTAPSFSRDFAGLKTLDHGVGPSITFTRASNATFFDASGTLQTAANDTPRFDHDPATAGNPSRGLLIEETRTNLFERSAEFDDAYWNKTSTTVTANNAASPSSTTTADLVEKTGNETTTPARTLAVAASAHTASVFAKNSSGNRLRLRIDATGGTVVSAVFNTADGTVVSTDAGVTASVQSVGNGWYRCIATYTFASAVNSSIGFSPRNEGADATGAKAWLWGAQVEAGAFATSYIPTTTAAATRSSDSAVVTPIASFYNQSEGTLFVEATTAAFAAYRYLAAITAGAALADRSFDMSKSTNNEFELLVNLSNAGQANPKISPWNGSGANKTIAAVANDNVGASLNGSAVSTDTSATIPTNVDRLTIGRRADGGTPLNGHIRRIAYYPRRLSNSLLQQLTT
jgi:hypothetical protein